MPFNNTEKTPLVAKTKKRRNTLLVRSIDAKIEKKGKIEGLSSHLTHFDGQETLKASIVCFLAYSVVSVIAYSYVFESWTIIDSLYFAVVTLFTVGYGDITPTTDGGRLFTIFFMLPGIIAIGIGLGMLGEIMAEYQETYKKGCNEFRTTNAMAMFNPEESTHTLLDELQDSAKSGVLRTILTSGYTRALVLLVGLSIIIGFFEKWTVIESAYFFVVTATTCGYGDLTPDTQSMRLVVFFFLPLCVGLVGYIIGDIAQWYTDKQIEKAEEEFLRKDFTLKDLEAMDADHSDSVDMVEFITFMLVRMQKVDREDIDRLTELFKKIDVDGSGSLDRNDLRMMAERRLAKTTQKRNREMNV